MAASGKVWPVPAQHGDRCLRLRCTSTSRADQGQQQAWEAEALGKMWPRHGECECPFFLCEMQGAPKWPGIAASEIMGDSDAPMWPNSSSTGIWAVGSKLAAVKEPLPLSSPVASTSPLHSLITAWDGMGCSGNLVDTRSQGRGGEVSSWRCQLL